ncbi:MAG: ATP-binding protein [Desulfobulbia bacterium]
MRVSDLYLGNVDGSEEFQNKERIDNLYFLGVRENEIAELISGRKRYVHGYKGTGKTSLIKVLENKCREDGTPYISMSYRKVREDAEVIHEFREKFKLFKDRYDEEEDRDTTTLTFWKWYLLSLIAKQFVDVESHDLIYETKQRFFQAMASVLDMLIVTVDPSGSMSLGLNIKKSLGDEDENIVKAARAIRSIASKIENNLNKKVILFIDEVELTKARSTYGIDRTMIKNLLIATKYVNDITSNLHVVLAVRDEVVYDLRGDEINKLLEDFGVQVSWWSKTSVTVDHALWRLMFKKIRYSMTKNGENTDRYTDFNLWNRWFPFTIDGKESWKFLFEITWARPRDFVRLLSMMQDHCRDQVHFTRSGYDLAIRSYSQSAFSEISEEISTLFDDQTMSKISGILQELGINFPSHSFIEKARKRGIISPSIVLDEMYRVGLVGQHFLDQDKVGKWRFFYRNDMAPDLSKPFTVHRALHDALGVKGKFNEAILYS